MTKIADKSAKGARGAARTVTTVRLRNLGGGDITRTVKKIAGNPAVLVAKQLPGWKLVAQSAPDQSTVEDAAMNNEQGPTLAQLRSKFLGVGLTDSLEDNTPILGHSDKDVQTVQVQRKRGGAIKTADIKKGKVQIVQG